MRTEIPRQLVHLSGLLFVILAQSTGRVQAVFYFVLLSLFFLLYSEYVKRQEKKWTNVFRKFESGFRDFVYKFERKDIKNPFTGAFWFYAGCSIALILYPFGIASSACAMLAVGDSLSTLVGKKFGKHKIGKKTFEGSLACFLGSLAAGLFFVAPLIALAGALTACLAELFSKINDNLTIPVVSGLVMLLVSIL
jgi:dolichol kinase